MVGFCPQLELPLEASFKKPRSWIMGAKEKLEAKNPHLQVESKLELSFEVGIVDLEETVYKLFEVNVTT